MPRLKSSREIIETLEVHGFTFISQNKGSHAKYFNSITKMTVIVPVNRREIPFGTFSSIVRQSGLSKDDFE